jgi:hypothetical protein
MSLLCGARGPSLRLALLLALLLALPRRCGAQVAPWPQTWNLNASTIVMACNVSGDLDPAAVAAFAVVDLDWSSGKAAWAKERPMQADASLVRQALAVAAAVPGRRVFTYRNAILALPWFSDVRAKLADPAYAAWFVPFGPPTVNGTGWHVPPCDSNYNPPLCSALYHGQVQTPHFPGQCAAPACDCGGVPCGEYQFDFRAANVSVNGQTLAEWYVEDYFFGPTALGHAGIAGLYVDDFWSAAGPSETDPAAVQDMGLSPAAVADMVAAYRWLIARAGAAVTARGKWTWSEFLNNDPFQSINGGCPQPWVRQATCAADLRALCSAGAPAQSRTLLYGFAPGCPSLDPAHLASPQHDIANFQLVRGASAFLGSGWQGCSAALRYEFPQELNADFGAPAGACAEAPPGSGVFVREFQRATVQMDCATWTPTITWR